MSHYSKEDIIKFVEENDVEFIRLQFTDLFGILKNVAIPKSQLKKALDNQMMFDGSSIDGFARIEESDMCLRPDLDSFVIILHVTVEILIQTNAKLLGYGNNPPLFDRTKVHVSPTFQIIVLSTHIFNHTIAKGICHTNRKSTNRTHKAACITHFLIGTVIITSTFHRFQPVGVHY